MNENAILNYPGSKKRLLKFILNTSKQYIISDKYILDIFSGTGCVSQMFKKNGYKVYANDVEVYASNISSTLLRNCYNVDFNELEKNYLLNKNKLLDLFTDEIKLEDKLLENSDKMIIDFDNDLPKIWKDDFSLLVGNVSIKTIDDLNKNIDLIPFCLFTLYYSGIYFGLRQSIEIDSIRYAI